MSLKKIQKFKFDYDSLNDDLFLFSSSSKSKGSIEFGNVILDFNSKRELVGIQFMNASKFITTLTGDENIKSILQSLKESKVEVTYQENIIVIKFYLIGSLKEVSSTLSVPSIVESSPALAYA
jgi:uncharacterized protein YuzE